MTIRFLHVSVLAVLALTACDATPSTGAGAAKTASAESSYSGPMILTAQGWGPLAVGMRRDQLIEVAGGPADPAAPQPAVPDAAMSSENDTPAADVSPVTGESESCEVFHPSRAPTGLRVMFQDGHLARITLGEGAQIKMQTGLAIGDTAEAVKTAYGRAVIAQPHKYEAAPAEYLYVWTGAAPTGEVTDPDARGLRFEIGTDGRVAAIQAGDRSIQLVEGCG